MNEPTKNTYQQFSLKSLIFILVICAVFCWLYLQVGFASLLIIFLVGAFGYVARDAHKARRAIYFYMTFSAFLILPLGIPPQRFLYINVLQTAITLGIGFGFCLAGIRGGHSGTKMLAMFILSIYFLLISAVIFQCLKVLGVE